MACEKDNTTIAVRCRGWYRDGRFIGTITRREEVAPGVFRLTIRTDQPVFYICLRPVHDICPIVQDRGGWGVQGGTEVHWEAEALAAVPPASQPDAPTDTAARDERDQDADETVAPEAPPADSHEEWVAETDGVMWGVTPRSAPMLFRLCESEQAARELAARLNAEETRS